MKYPWLFIRSSIDINLNDCAKPFFKRHKQFREINLAVHRVSNFQIKTVYVIMQRVYNIVSVPKYE